MNDSVHTQVPRKILTMAILGSFAVILLLAGCGKSQDATGAPGGPPEFVAPVQVQPIERSSMTETVELIGTVRSRYRVELSCEIEGVVKQVLKREGDPFNEGDLLVQIGEEDYEIEVDAARAELEKAKETLKELLRGPRQEIIDRLEAELKSQQAAVKDAELELERKEGLFDSDVVSQAELDRARFARDREEATLKAIQAQLSEARNGATAEEIARSRAEVAARESALQKAVRDLEKTRIKAPFTGRVVKLSVEKGAYVQPGTVLLEIVSTEELDIYFNIPERLIARIDVGDSVRVRSEVLSEEEVTVNIDAIVPAADEASRNFPARCEILGDPRFKPGMLVRLDIVVGQKDNVLTASQDAVMNNNGMSFVYVVKDGQAEMVPVKIGLRSTEKYEIQGNLEEGDQVIVVGNEIVFPGARVQVTTPGQSGEMQGPPPGA